MFLEDEFNREPEEFFSDEFFNQISLDPIDSVDEPKKDEAIEEKPLETKEKTSSLCKFLQEIEQELAAEGKIHAAIEFMRDALSSGSTPRFKDFWEVRKLCLPLFKESISPKNRSLLWSDYIALSTEAKRLKEILDEKSAFAVEQIELAIQALERDLEHYSLLLSQTKQELLPYCISLQEKKNFYEPLQNELNLLNQFVLRLQALRKETIKTEMRIRIKNRLLERLSSFGDQVFPKRKELIKKISQEFVEDVQCFIDTHFQENAKTDVPLYVLREEIKQLQSIGKILTLNSQAFTLTRLKLSECWDQIREEEKEKKKQLEERRQFFKENFNCVMEKIIPFAACCQEGLSIEECHRQASEILEFMRTLALSKEDVRALKEEIFKAKEGPLAKLRQQEEEKRQEMIESARTRKETIEKLKTALQELIDLSPSLDIETFSANEETLLMQYKELHLSKIEKILLDPFFRQIKEVIEEKKQQALLNLSEEDKEALGKLKTALKERQQRRKEIKAQLEQDRKLLAGSGFDFEQAMLYRERIEEERASFAKIESLIEEIEERIEEIER